MRKASHLLLIGSVCVAITILFYRARANQLPAITPRPSFKIFAGPDPSNPSELFRLLRNESVCAELGLSDQQRDAVQEEEAKQIQKLLQRSKDSRHLQLPNSPEDQKKRIEEMKKMMEEQQAGHKSAIDEILTPDQAKRFAQILYRVEVYRAGMAEALLNGRLGNAVEVTEDQRVNLTDKIRRIENETKLKIDQLRRDAEQAMLNELSTEQRTNFANIMGEHFPYHEPNEFEQRQTMMETIRQGKFKPRLKVIP